MERLEREALKRKDVRNELRLGSRFAGVFFGRVGDDVLGLVISGTSRDSVLLCNVPMTATGVPSAHGTLSSRVSSCFIALFSRSDLL